MQSIAELHAFLFQYQVQLQYVKYHVQPSSNSLVLGGLTEIEVTIHANSRVLLLGGAPFESPILLWWNFVGRTQEELKIAREQWVNGDERFGSIPSYTGKRLEAPVFPDSMRASK